MTAWTNTGSGEIEEIMGFVPKIHQLKVQFHPESILTEHGHHKCLILFFTGQ